MHLQCNVQNKLKNLVKVDFKGSMVACRAKMQFERGWREFGGLEGGELDWTQSKA